MKGLSIFKSFLLLGLMCFSVGSFADTPISDSAITMNIQSKISEDKLLNGIHVNTSTNKQIVSFSGEVDSEAQADNLVQLAQSTVGVKDVDTSKLKIKGSHQPLDDMYITAKVKGTFIKEKVFGDKDISVWSVNVETTNGIVYLTGNVESKSQAENAIKLAQSISGVKKVKYRIKVMRDHELNYDMNNY